MEIFKQIAPLKAFLEGIKRSGKTVGLVPTMGALHQGHISLVEASKSNNHLTVATIYINPAQFNNATDLRLYPRTWDQDVEMLERVGCDVLFCPDDNDMYEEKPQIQFQFGHLDTVMEGKYRPGHFSGVALIVSKLFHIIQPDTAYFGQKDWQQFAVIRLLINELKFNISLFSVPILREENGLALSSRNLRLTKTQHHQAAVFYRALLTAKDALKRGEDLQTVKVTVKSMVENDVEMSLEYFELANSKTLNLLDAVDETESPILCIAGRAGDVRLIDNMFLD